MIINPPDAPWGCRFALPSPSPVRLVSAAAGLVVAVGSSLHMLRPGSERLRSRPLPPDFEAIAVAAEPWSPFRYAVATSSTVSIYTGHRPYTPEVELHVQGPEARATHLAWARHDGESMLCLRQANGNVSRLRPDIQSHDVLSVPVIHAIASDVDGVLALAALQPEPPANVGDVMILPKGSKEWAFRWVDWTILSEDDELPFHLAVRGEAVALATDAPQTMVSWEEAEEDGGHFETPPCIFGGPIAFAGDGVLIAAYNVEGKVNVLRHVRGGGATRIARFGRDDNWKGTAATVTGLAWDDERRALWVASPELGLIELTERKAGPQDN